jgi:hypothetical protein
MIIDGKKDELVKALRDLVKYQSYDDSISNGIENIVDGIESGYFTTKAVPLTDLLAWVEENFIEYDRNYVAVSDLKAAVTKMAEGK